MSAEIKPEILALSALIAADVKYDPATGVGVTSADLYASLLPEGLTMDHVLALQDHNTNVFAGAAHAVGTTSIPVMVEHKDLNKTTVQIAVGKKDVIRVNFDRERTFPDNQNKGTITKPGQVNIDYVQYGTKNRGEVTKVKSFLTTMAMEALVAK